MFAGRKLLVADDSPYYQTVLGLTFTDEGMAVDTAGGGPDALAKLEQSTPDVVLASVSMPGFNGYELCELIKQSERFGHIPVMLLVGLHEPFDQAEARRVGADDVVTKPFKSIRQLVSRVGSLLGGESAETDDATHLYSTLGLDRSQPVHPAALEHQITEDAPVKVFVEAASMVDDEPPEPAVEAESCDADVERQTADTQKLESPAPVPTASPDQQASDDAGVKVFVEAPATIEHEAAEPAVAAASCATDVELQTADTQKLERIEDEPFGEAIEPIAYAEDDTMEMPKVAIAATPVLSPDLGSNERPSSFGASEMNNEPGPRSVPWQPQRGLNDALLDLGELNNPASRAVADDLILDLEYEEAATAARLTAPEIIPESVAAASLVAGGATETARLAPDSTAEKQPVAELQEWAIVTETRAEATPASTVRDPEPAEQKLQLSPETIDAIARRVVEQLSEKVVSEIAWEVVPELAELLIKKKLDEQK